ncbi:flavin reductase family protein [Nocardioides sp. T5]|uniref:flavin reductase family protein n=1 Tax=Nocardioides sp. T5 TaxID=3400182 RepID=UPI003A83DE62
MNASASLAVGVESVTSGAPGQVPEHGQFDARKFRDVVGNFASGIVIVTSVHDGEPAGLTCQSFYSVSLEPPLVSFSVSTSSRTYPTIRESGQFCVNLLAASQFDISTQFAMSGTDKWAGITWRPTESGNPIISGAIGWIDCSIDSEYVAGDHVIVIGRVRGISLENFDEDPLLYFRGQYRHLRGN